MKGRILGFTPSSGTGTISGDDGNRYGFSAAEWRSDKAIAAGVAVDFDLRGSEAIGIYPVVAAGMGSVDMGAIATSPAAIKAKALLTGTLAFPLGILVLVACLLTAMSSPERSVSLFSLGDVVGRLGPLASGGDHTQELADIDKQIATVTQEERTLGPAAESPSYGFGSTGDRLKQLTDQKAKIEQIASGEQTLSFTRSILFIRFAAPLCALWLLWACWSQGAAIRLASLATGASAIVAGLLPHLLKHALIGALGNFGEGMGDALSVGVGAWILLITGIALILAGLGIIRNPLAKSA